jgi:group I intron endonuclease
MITYIATNTVNGKFYIGSTINFEKRKREHLSLKRNYPFQCALQKDPESFEWEVYEDDSHERILEQALLDMWAGTEQCYNLGRDSSNGMVGRKHTEEACQKMSVRAKGRKKSEEIRLRMSEAQKGKNNPNFGKRGPDHQRYGMTHTDATRQKIGDKRKGRKWWVNNKGETMCQSQSPGDGWRTGRIWR